MEDSKRFYKFYGKPGEDFHLWAARTEAALEAKEVLDVVEVDVLTEGPLGEEVQKKVSKARATIMQRLDDRPLRLCLSVKDDPFRMWRKLRDRYAVSNTATKVQLQTKLSGMSYKSQPMQDYVDGFEEVFNRLAAMQSEIAEDLQVAMLLASFGDKNKSPFGHLISSMQAIQDHLDWETATASLIQEYEEQLLQSENPRISKLIDPGQALSMTSGPSPGKGKKSFAGRREKRRCFICHKVGHIARNRPQKRNRTQKWQSSEDPYDGSVHGEENAQPAQLFFVQQSDSMAGRTLKGIPTDGNPGEAVSLADDIKIEKGNIIFHACWYCGHSFEFCRKASIDELDVYCSDFDCDEDYLAVAADMKNSKADIGSIFLLDSGASDHMVRDKEWLHDLQKIEPRSIALGDGNRVCANFKGNLTLRTAIGEPGDQYERTITLRDVLCVPQLRSNLLPCSKLCESDCRINIRRTKCNGLHNGIIQFEGRLIAGVYRINAKPIKHESIMTLAANSERIDGDGEVHEDNYTMKLWHARLGHSNIESIRALSRSNAVTGLDLHKKKNRRDLCSSCMKGKQTKQTLRKNKSRSHKKCAVIHTDICGPMSIESFSGARYFVSFIDEYTGYIVIVPVKKKSDVLEQFKVYQAWLERKFDCRVKRVHSDNGGEYIAMKGYLTQQGIEHTMSPSYCPNQNAIAERANRTIVECARSMLEHASLPRRFWAEAIVHAATIRNLFPSPSHKTKTSYELMTGAKPNVSYLRVFGCRAWYHIPKDLRKKLDSKSESGIVVACMANSQYKLWIPARGTAVIARDVTIDEDYFPARNTNGPLNDDATSPLPENDQMDTRLSVSSAHHKGNLLESVAPGGSNDVQAQPELLKPTDHGSNLDSLKTLTDGQMESLTHYPTTTEENTVPSEQHSLRDGGSNVGPVQERRYPQRTRRSPSFYDPSSAALGSALSMVEEYGPEPRSVSEALSQDDAEHWKAAIESELNSLKEHGTWETVTRKEAFRPLSTKFVFLRKFDEHGRVIRHKARLVVRGFLQGDVHQTFAPVVDFTTVRVCLALAIQRGYLIQQLDVRTAFLHGEIDEEIFISAPDGLELCRPDQILKLRKGLYGLKQGPRLWYDKWQKVMKAMGFTKLASDECVFRRKMTWLLIYVDDILLIGENHSTLMEVKLELSKYIDVKDLGSLYSFLGVLFIREADGGWLSQKHYIAQVIQRFGMSSCKPVTTPMSQGALSEMADSKEVPADKAIFQELLGCLLFIATRTRPDINAAVSILCRYSSNPSYIHWIFLKRIVRYLQGTTGYCLRIFREDSAILQGLCDADWAGDRRDRRSTSGILLRLGSTSISWKTIKQNAVTLSTTEAEYLALSEGTKLIIWLRSLLKELDCSQDRATVILEDNQGAVIWVTEGVRHAKHISIRRNFVKENSDRGVVDLVYCPANKMIPDVLTKPLLCTVFEAHRKSMGILPVMQSKNL